MNHKPKLPSVAQMKSRMLDGHHDALRRISRGENPVTEFMRAGEIQGMRTVIRTLHRWEVITWEWNDERRVNVYGITERGRELQEAL